MCGRYNFSQEESDEIREIVREVERRQRGEFKMGEIYPTNVAPVLVAGDDRPVPELLAWGFPRFDKKGVVINARAETAEEKRMFRDSVSTRRAVVPVSWFYEWNKNKEKFTFTKEGSRILFLAGFYGRYEDGEHFVILTTQANASMAPVHSRMPLVLEREQVRDWILDSAKTKELLGQEPPQLDRDCEYEQQTLF